MQVLTVLSGTASLKTDERFFIGQGERRKEEGGEREREKNPLSSLQPFAFTSLSD